MNKEEKVKVVEELKGQLSDYKSIYLTDIAGLDALQTSKLRRECFNSDIKLSVVKNTFLQRAMSESENDFGELKDLLKGNTTIMLSKTGNSPAKVIKKFRKDGDKPILKGAFVDEAIYIGDEHIEALFNLKSKEEVLGEIISILQSPAKNVISALKSSSGKIAGLVKTLTENPVRRASCRGSKGRRASCRGSKGRRASCRGSKGRRASCRGSKSRRASCRGSKGRR